MRRLLALEGAWRTAAARAAGMDRQPLRDWVIRYSAEGVEGLCDRPRNFAALVKEALPATARAKPLKIWFQDDARRSRPVHLANGGQQRHLRSR